MKSELKSKRLFLMACAIVSLALSSVRASAADFYPYQDPYMATLTARLMKPSRVRPQQMVVAGLPGRDNVALLEGRSGLEVSVYAQKNPAPLVYVIPGLGGNADDGAALWIAEQLYLNGYSSMVLASPMYWKFVLSQSTTGVPGFTPEDAKDMRRLMATSRAQAERQYGMQVTTSAVTGYSLGAIDAAFVMAQERANPTLGLTRAVMINPPLNIAAALAKLDQLNNLGNQWTPDQRNLLWGHVLSLGQNIISHDINEPNYFVGLDKVIDISQTQTQYLIGNSFRQTLGEAVFTSQQIADLGLLHLPATSGSRSVRENEAARVTFSDFLQKASLPFWTKRMGRSFTSDQFTSQGDMGSLRALMARDGAFRMLHNQDDFLTRPSDLQSFASAMGPRAKIYPTGGHCGNIWFAQHNTDFLAQFR